MQKCTRRIQVYKTVNLQRFHVLMQSIQELELEIAGSDDAEVREPATKLSTS